MEIKEFLEEVKKRLPSIVERGHGICYAIDVVGISNQRDDLRVTAILLMNSEKVVLKARRMKGKTLNFSQGLYALHWFKLGELNSRLKLVDYMISICE